MTQYKSPPSVFTPINRAKRAYRSMLRRCSDGKSEAYDNVEVRMTMDEWLAWALPRFESFVTKYPDDIPHVARKGDKGHYEMGNVDVVPSWLNKPCRVTTVKTFICPVCGSEFNRTAQRLWRNEKEGKPPFCSRSCVAKGVSVNHLEGHRHYGRAGKPKMEPIAS